MPIFIIAVICLGLYLVIQKDTKKEISTYQGNTYEEKKANYDANHEVNNKRVHEMNLASDQRRREEESKGVFTCPHCGSHAVTSGTKGFTLTTGFIGSGNVRLACMSCGKKWKPKG